MYFLRVALITILLTGCAATTRAPLAKGECQELIASLATTDGERRAALEKQQGAWKAVIPVAVAARYVKAKAEVAEADERSAELQRELARRGCAEEP